MRVIRRAASIATVGLFLCLAALPVYAHDDEAPAPPSARDVAAAGRVTTAVLALGAGFAVFYGVQRHRVMNADKHPPEWDKKMGVSAVLFAVITAAVVGGVTAALSRPSTPAVGKASSAAPASH